MQMRRGRQGDTVQLEDVVAGMIQYSRAATGSARYPPVLLTYGETYLCSEHLRHDIPTKKCCFFASYGADFFEDFILNVRVCTYVLIKILLKNPVLELK